MALTTRIDLHWDSVGNIRHTISGHHLPPPRDDQINWILAPSAPLLLAHQFGVMKPSHALVTAGWLVDSLFHNRYVIMPINSALKAASIELRYTQGPRIKLLFHPKHGLFANSDSGEEAVRQLLNNYARHVFTHLDHYGKIVLRTMTTAAIGEYYEFLQELISSGSVGRHADRWAPLFSLFSASLIGSISENYYVPEGGENADNEDWAREQTEFLQDRLTRITSLRQSILTSMGMA